MRGKAGVPWLHKIIEYSIQPVKDEENILNGKKGTRVAVIFMTTPKHVPTMKDRILGNPFSTHLIYLPSPMCCRWQRTKYCLIGLRYSLFVESAEIHHKKAFFSFHFVHSFGFLAEGCRMQKSLSAKPGNRHSHEIRSGRGLPLSHTALLRILKDAPKLHSFIPEMRFPPNGD